MEELSEDERLRREYEALPKSPWHGVTAYQRHSDIRPEWVMRVIHDPYEEWMEGVPGGEINTILSGRVPEFRQWIKVVFDESGTIFYTAYADRRLVDRYGGRPWENT